MDLEQMKNDWGALSAQLELNNNISARLVREMISSRNRTSYQQIARDHKVSLSVMVLMATLALPFMARTELIRMGSFAIVEAVSFVGIAITSYMLHLLTRREQSYRTVSETTQDILIYKRLYRLQQLWGTSIALVVIGVVYAIERAFTVNALVPLALSLIAATVIGIHQTRRHKHLLQEIEQGLDELREFGAK